MAPQVQAGEALGLDGPPGAVDQDQPADVVAARLPYPGLGELTVCDVVRDTALPEAVDGPVGHAVRPVQLAVEYRGFGQASDAIA